MPLPDDLPRRDGIHHLTLEDGRRAVFKRRGDAPADFFQAEVRGLELLRQARALRVPDVYAHAAEGLLLEDLGHGLATADFHALAGRGLADQHANTGPHFGFGHPGWCGDSIQDNTPDDDGHRFFAERRLLPQAYRARDTGLLQAHEMQKVERLCAHLQQLLPAQPPVLLHGDLWTGNLHCCADGRPALVDAGAVHYGWAEAELAMLILFSSPAAVFFDAYAESAPLAADWRQRAPIYNLYHLLNHLNLFGSGYVAAVRDVLSRYA